MGENEAENITLFSYLELEVYLLNSAKRKI